MHAYNCDSLSNPSNASSPPTQGITHTHQHHQYRHGQHKSTTINPLPPNTLLQTRSYRSQTELSISLGHKAEERTHRRTPGPVKAFKRHQTTAAGIVLAHGLGGDCYVKCRQRRRKWEEMTQAGGVCSEGRQDQD